MSNVILTNAGRYFPFNDPYSHEYTIAEIAHALSHINRFTGHTHTPYTVAQHSVLVSHIIDPKYALEGLLHDAAEAYLGDVASPLKRLLPDYKGIEREVEGAIALRFGLRTFDAKCHSAIKAADLTMLVTERRDLLPMSPYINDPHWPDIEPMSSRIRPVCAQTARHLFIKRYEELTT